MAETDTIEANAQRHYEVTRADLPLSCPTPQMRLWNSHPRVFLPIEQSGHSQCPYCGAIYTLVDHPATDHPATDHPATDQ